MPFIMSSQPTFIKIKYKDSIRKVQVAQQPAPVWSKLVTAIRARFAISDNQSIGLQYLDPDEDLITVSSQVELDELWEEIKSGAKLKAKDGVDRRLIKLDLIIIESDLKSEFVLLESSSEVDPGNVSASVHSPDSDALPAFLGSPVGDLNSPFNHSAVVESIDAPTDPIEATVEPSVTPAEPIVESAAPQPVRETQSAPDPPEEVVEDHSPPPSSRANASLGMEHLPAMIAVAVGSVAPELQRTLGSYAQLMVDATSQLNNACRVVAERLQDPAQPTPLSHTPTASNMFGSRTEPYPCAPTSSEPGERHVPGLSNPNQPNAPPEMPVPPPKPSVRPCHEPFAMPASRFGPPPFSAHPFHAHRGMRMSNGFGHTMPPFPTARGHHPHSFFRMPSHSPPHHRMASPPPHRRMASPSLHPHRMTSPPPLHHRMSSPPLHLDKPPSPVLASRQVPPGAAIWEQLMAYNADLSKTASAHAPSVVQSPSYPPSLVASTVYAPPVFQTTPRHSPAHFHATPRHSPSVYHAAPVLSPTEEHDQFERPAGDSNKALKGRSAHGSHEYAEPENGRLEQEPTNAQSVHTLDGRSEGVGDWKGKRASEIGRKKRSKGGIQWQDCNDEGLSDHLKFPVIRSAGSVEVVEDEWGIKPDGKKNGGVGGVRRGSKIAAHFSWDD